MKRLATVTIMGWVFGFITSSIISYFRYEDLKADLQDSEVRNTELNWRLKETQVQVNNQPELNIEYNTDSTQVLISIISN